MNEISPETAAKEFVQVVRDTLIVHAIIKGSNSKRLQEHRITNLERLRFKLRRRMREETSDEILEPS